MDEAFSSIDLVGQCLLDKQRTESFRRVISETVKPNMVVLDAGTGSGILAMLSARAGASKVYAIELDPYVASVAKNNIKSNGLENVVEVIESDMRYLKLPSDQHIDIVTMEMLTTGMIDEYQVYAINQLKKLSNIDERTIFLPMKQDSFISFGFSDFNIYELNFPMILHLWDIHANKDHYFKSISERIKYDSYTFSEDSRTKINVKIETIVHKTCTINAILLESESLINHDISVGETPALNGKVMIPIEAKKVVEHEKIISNLSYEYGAGFKSLSFKWL